MPPQNQELMREAFDAFNNGDPSVFLSLYDPDIVLRISPPDIDAGTYHGAEAVERHYFEFFAAFGGTYRFEFVKLVPVGDSVLALAKSAGRGRRSGAEVHSRPLTLIATIRGGKIIRMDQSASLEEACAILGVREEDVR
jgi:ketosteroid isomerase-like protein